MMLGYVLISFVFVFCFSFPNCFLLLPSQSLLLQLNVPDQGNSSLIHFFFSHPSPLSPSLPFIDFPFSVTPPIRIRHNIDLQQDSRLLAPSSKLKKLQVLFRHIDGVELTCKKNILFQSVFSDNVSRQSSIDSFEKNINKKYQKQTNKQTKKNSIEVKKNIQ